MANGQATDTATAILAYLGADDGLAGSLQAALERVGATFIRIDPDTHLPERPLATGEAIALLDLRIAPRSADIESRIVALKGGFGTAARVFCIAPASTFDQRLEAFRAGADGFLPFEASAPGREALSSRLADLARSSASPARILVVDDEPVVALFAYRVLQGAGMEVSAVSDPQLALDALTSFRPDLVLMDLHMPQVSGIELTRVIRDDDRWCALPIVFFSGEMDPAAQIETLRVGGDDFLAKPVTPQRLLAVVQGRLQRSRKRHGGANSNALSGVLDRRAFLRRINQRLLAMEKEDQPRAALFLIGRTDSSAPAVPAEALDGDRFTAQIAHRLAMCLGPSDTLGLLDVPTFGLLAERDDQEALIALGDRLRQAVATLEGGEGRSHLALSIGLAPLELPADDPLTLLSRAERALADARQLWGRRVVTYTAVSRTSTNVQHRAWLHRALQGDGFQLYFQPIAALRQDQGELYEVCLRLHTPDGEHISASDILPIAKEAGFMPGIDDWVLEKALTTLEHHRPAHNGLRFLIHQSLNTTANARWIDRLRDLIVAHDLVKDRPTLCFPYAELAADASAAEGLFKALSRLGIGICVDLPEPGPMAWRLIECLSPTLVRLAYEQIGPLAPDELRATIARLHTTGVRVIVVGIEDPLAISRIWSSRVDLIQGNFVQPPGPRLDFNFTETVLE